MQKSIHIVCSAIMLISTIGGRACAEEVSRTPAVIYLNYASVLTKYVNDNGMVDYKGLKENRKSLDNFVEQVSKIPKKTYNGWSAKKKTAFWINVYNAMTLRTIIDNYPIKPSRIMSIHFPKNSIRQIPKIWKNKDIDIFGKKFSLNDIEHKILRKEFDEPRIHVSLVCAAMGCPPLRKEPYTGARLDKQLDDQAVKFLSKPLKFKIDKAKSIVYLSSIFKWFSKDFPAKYRLAVKKGDPLGRFSENNRAVLNFISKYLNKTDAEYLPAGNYKIEYLSYDWSLNEQKDKTANDNTKQK